MERLAYLALLPDQELEEMLQKKDLRHFKKILLHLFPEAEGALERFGDFYLQQSLQIIHAFKQEHRVKEYRALLKSLIVSYQSRVQTGLDLRLYQFAYRRKQEVQKRNQQASPLKEQPEAEEITGKPEERESYGTTH